MDESLVDFVSRDRYLRQIIEEVVEQNLRRQHRQKRQKHRRGGHAEHVAEVRTRSHQKVLHDVAERLASLNDADGIDHPLGVKRTSVDIFPGYPVCAGEVQNVALPLFQFRWTPSTSVTNM